MTTKKICRICGERTKKAKDGRRACPGCRKAQPFPHEEDRALATFARKPEAKR